MRKVSCGALFISASILAITVASAEEIALDTITVTATRVEQKAIDQLAGVSVVDKTEIERFNPDSISDVLRQIPGVWTQENANDPAQSINIRGLQDFGRVAVLVDGARQNYAVSGHNANGQFYLDPELISTVDVTRGPVSSIYGSGAIGGVVLFNTRGVNDLLTKDEKVGVQQKLVLGTNGYGFLSSTSAGVRINSAADVYGQFLTRKSYNYKDGGGASINDTGNEVISGLFKLNIRPADGHEISATALRQKNEFSNSGSSNQGARFGDVLNTGTYTLGYRFRSPETPLLDLNMKAYVSDTHMSQRYLADSPNGTYRILGAVPGVSRIIYDQKTTGFDIFNTSRFQTGALSHTLTYGVDGVWDKVDTFDTAAGYGSAFTPGGKRTLFGAYAQDEVRYADWLRIVAGVRYDHYELSSATVSADGGRVSPKFTIGVTPIAGLELYATYAEAYRAPTITETLIQGNHPFPAFRILPNPDLRPEVAHNLEAGVNLKYNDVLRPGDSFRAKATVFRNEIDNYIGFENASTSTLVAFIPGLPNSVCALLPPAQQRRLCALMPDQQYQNIAKVRLTGAELEAAYDWGWGFTSVAGTITQGKDRQTNYGIASVPPNRISGTLGFRFLDNRLTVGGRLTGVFAKSRSDLPPTDVALATAGYSLVDLFASYNFNDWVRADVSVQNLFDKRYVQYLNYTTSAGMQAKAGLTIKFASH